MGLTEPGGGSDIAAMRTRARRASGGWVLNGSKMFITNGPVADVVYVLAVTDPDRGPKEGITGFLVERGTPGFRSGPPLKKLGCRGSPTSELIFEDCFVPDSAVLGEVGRGFLDVLTVLERARVGFGAWCLGVAQACLDEAVKYARQREAFGRPIAEFQAIRWKLADMRTAVDAARLLLLRAAWLMDQGKPARLAASTAKLAASEAATLCAHHALQIHGGYGYIQEFPIERLYRDARLAEIGEGTSEIQRHIIAEALLKGDWELEVL